MNDFTKDDLKLILQWRKEVKYTKKPTAQMIALNERLGEKIQCMIDNYKVIRPSHEEFADRECMIKG